jgi:hypothetical protein
MSGHQQYALGGLKRPDAIDEVFGRANPNPERIGCPSREVLEALARRERPISDPAYDHLGECSPCYLEARALKEASDQRRRRVMTWATALMLAVGAIAWVLVTRKVWRTSESAPIRRQLDLRPYAGASGASHGDLSPAVLPRADLMLTLLLPTGAKPGPYEVQVRDSDATTRASALGHGERRNGVDALDVALDLGDLPAGAYALAVRPDGHGWQQFPVRLE